MEKAVKRAPDCTGLPVIATAVRLLSPCAMDPGTVTPSRGRSQSRGYRGPSGYRAESLGISAVGTPWAQSCPDRYSVPLLSSLRPARPEAARRQVSLADRTHAAHPSCRTGVPGPFGRYTHVAELMRPPRQPSSSRHTRWPMMVKTSSRRRATVASPTRRPRKRGRAVRWARRPP
jgi:hypothetical protein